MPEVFKTLQKCFFQLLKLSAAVTKNWPSRFLGFCRQQTSSPPLKIPNTLLGTYPLHDLILHFLCILLEPIILCLLYRISNSSLHGNIMLPISMTLRIQPLFKKSTSRCYQWLQNCSTIHKLIWLLMIVLTK